ncbi:AbrB/MazE/SpoVT family DNA-binding domain-containing protein [Moorella sp. Hama-1]|uniref:AbrB/MazE/SpoVT family DNA-binding domain-containing protein n=1 Tax=Moorella sp. Hama-1 TaxID=2138101 RepID=UPI000D654BDF|nr:AbrB/MazE/SpoVT family DNA-binding domain-containing protein [Moorella sp. Hama-1]MDN5362279.1 hypothetical protein [Moorella sp. (in: firmicutes)]BCV22802.1 hypothetical protein hamaS1_28710 [Moorella sp. Hama-1]
MAVTSLSTKGQVVIPKWIRETLKLKSGARFLVELEGGRIILKPVKESIAADLYGKYQGLDLLGDLLREHQQELNNDGKKR